MNTLLAMISYTVACFWLGHLCLKQFSKAIENENSIGLSFAIGSVVISICWLALGLIGWLTPAVIWATLVFSILSLLYRARKYLPISESIAFGKLIPPSERIFSLLPWLPIILVTIWFAILAYARPPFGDASAFYMTYPKIIAAKGLIEPMPGQYHDFSAIGLSGELHSAALMVISSTAIAKLFTWFTGMACLLVLIDIVKLSGGRSLAQIATSAILITTTTFTDYLSDGKTDLFSTLIALAAVQILLLWSQDRAKPAMLLLCGFLTGSAATAKFSLIPSFAPAIIVLWLFITLNRHSGARFRTLWSKEIAESILWGSIGLFLGAMPHLVKNGLLFGNPFAPFWGMSSNWADQGSWFSTQSVIWMISTYPFSIVFGRYPLMGGNLSFLWLVLLPLIFWKPAGSQRLAPAAKWMTIAALTGLVLWIVVKPTVFVPRYYLPTLLLLVPLPALAFERIASRVKIFSGLYLVIASIAVLLVPWQAPAGVWTARPRPISAYLLNGQPECGLSISSYCSGFLRLNEKVKVGERVFLAGYYSFHLKTALLETINRPEEWKLMTEEGETNIWQKLFESRFRWIVVQKATHGQLLATLKKTESPDNLHVTLTEEDTDMPIFHLEPAD